MRVCILDRRCPPFKHPIEPQPRRPLRLPSTARDSLRSSNQFVCYHPPLSLSLSPLRSGLKPDPTAAADCSLGSSHHSALLFTSSLQGPGEGVGGAVGCFNSLPHQVPLSSPSSHFKIHAGTQRPPPPRLPERLPCLNAASESQGPIQIQCLSWIAARTPRQAGQKRNNNNK